MTTWTEKAVQSETWTEPGAHRPRIFSPLVFAPWPVFAVGILSDYWTDKTEQPETWTAV